MKKGNKDLSWNFYQQTENERPEPDAPDLHSRITDLENKIDELTKKINLIFGDNVLVHGQFVDLKL